MGSTLVLRKRICEILEASIALLYAPQINRMLTKNRNTQVGIRRRVPHFLKYSFILFLTTIIRSPMQVEAMQSVADASGVGTLTGAKELPSSTVEAALPTTITPTPSSAMLIDIDELKKTVPQLKPIHFVFAYGSLICKKSRAITAPTLADKEAIPVQIQDVERIWAKRTQRGMTAMGVRFRRGAKCTGMLLPVTESELARFDKREKGYDRYEIPLEDVEEVPFLVDKNHYEKMDYEHADVVFGEEETNDTTATDNRERVGEHKVFVWIYVQRYDCPADEDFPIAQSYVDIILRGCMGVSKEFARSFIETTKGWSPEEVYGEGEDDDAIDDSDNEDEEEEDRNNNCRPTTFVSDRNQEEDGAIKEEDNTDNGSSTEDGPHWVDDREDPIYMRADPEYSEKKADVIDQLLEDHIPEHLDNREPVTEEGDSETNKE